MTRFRQVPSAVVLAASTAIVVFGFGASMALASGNNSNHPSSKGLTCTPSHPHLGGGCQITFHDGNENKGYGGKAANANQQVCFTVNNPRDHVYGQTGNCSLTDKKGNAYGVFSAGVCGAATITATEAPEPGEPHGSATKTVVVVGGSCNNGGGGGDGGHGDGGHGDGGHGDDGHGHDGDRGHRQ